MKNLKYLAYARSVLYGVDWYFRRIFCRLYYIFVYDFSFSNHGLSK